MFRKLWQRFFGKPTEPYPSAGVVLVTLEWDDKDWSSAESAFRKHRDARRVIRYPGPERKLMRKFDESARGMVVEATPNVWERISDERDEYSVG